MKTTGFIRIVDSPAFSVYREPEHTDPCRQLYNSNPIKTNWGRHALQDFESAPLVHGRSVKCQKKAKS